MVDIIFDKSLKKEIITKILNKKINDDGIIVNSITEQPVLTTKGSEVHFKDLGIFENGSEIYIKDDLVSLMEYCKQ